MVMSIAAKHAKGKAAQDKIFGANAAAVAAAAKYGKDAVTNATIGAILDEAIPAVDKAIDDALIAGISQLRLIHGKGTGALRAGLTAYLENNRFVRKLETAALDAGGSGATVIDL